MKNLFILINMIIVLITLIGNQVLVSQNNTSYHIINSVQLDKTNCNDLTKLIIILPFAQSNQYQIVSNANLFNGELLDIPETDDKYLRYTLSQSDIQNQGNNFSVLYEFDVTLKSINFDFNQITQIYPYNVMSNNYLWYTGESGVYVDPNNSTIQNIGDSLWVQSSDIVNYAKKCYEYVASNYNYLNPYTGLHPLTDILNAGGGDCGNLSSIYISLLRHKNIPSRHIVTYRPDGSYHVWSDFYLENYGWIPVDVTYKQSNPNGNYFGKYDGNGIVVTKEVYLYLERDNQYSYYAPLLQTYNWWYWYGVGGCNSFISSHHISSNNITSIKELNKNKLFVYPNPSKEVVMFSSSFSISNAIVQIYSVSGNLVYETILNGKNEINIKNLNSGLYIFKIISNSVIYIEKFNKE